MNQPATDQPATTDVLLANPRSFCAGVEHAIEIVRTALTRYPPPVHVRKQIVHNSHVVAELERAGAVFVDDIDEVPAGATVIFSAHGVSPAVRAQAERKRLTVIDGIRPLVTEVHNEARRFADRGDTIVLIGHAGHEESEGTMGEAPDRTVLVETVADVARLDIEGPVSYLTQTTLAVDEAAEIVAALRTRFPRLRGPGADDICYATTNRQRSLRAVAADADVVLVVGSGNSSNSVRLVEIAERTGVAAYLIDDVSDIDPQWIDGSRSLAITAGASAPPGLVEEVVQWLERRGPTRRSERTVAEETVRFALPKEVRP